MSISKAHIPALLWTLLIASSCLAPAAAFKEFSFTLFELDKLIHLILYFVFVVLWALCYKQALTGKQKVTLATISIALGILIEVLQSTMSLGRSYEIDDIIANTVGCLLGIWSTSFVRRKLPLLKNRLPFLHHLY